MLATGICSFDHGAFVDDLEANDGPLLEGAVKLIRVNSYERNPVARRRCLEHYGTTCSVCGFDFGVVYGAVCDVVQQWRPRIEASSS